jgi:hypothetical protein
VGAVDARLERTRLAPRDLVLQEQLQELEVTELALASLTGAVLEAFQHAAQVQALQLRFEIEKVHAPPPATIA